MIPSNLVITLHLTKLDNLKPCNCLPLLRNLVLTLSHQKMTDESNLCCLVTCFVLKNWLLFSNALFYDIVILLAEQSINIIC